MTEQTATSAWKSHLEGKKVAFAGKIDEVHFLAQLMPLLGAKAVDEVDAETNYVVHGPSRGVPAALKKAESLNKKGAAIAVLEVEDFFSLLFPSDKAEQLALIKGIS